MELAEAAEQVGIEFLDNEIDLCETFLHTALVEADDPPARRMATSKAQRGYETALAWIDSIRDAQERARLMVKLFHLKDRLDNIDA